MKMVRLSGCFEMIRVKKILGLMMVLGLMPQLAGVNGVTVYGTEGAMLGTYTTIQQGVNACPIGGTVSVLPGTLLRLSISTKELKPLLKIVVKK